LKELCDVEGEGPGQRTEISGIPKCYDIMQTNVEGDHAGEW